MKQLLKDKEAVIFDLDGTLVDSMWIWVSVDEEYLEKYNLKEPENFYEGMEGTSYRETAQYYLECFPELPFTPEEIMAEWTEMVYHKYCEEVPLKEGAKAFLKDLKDRGISTGIATSNSRELAEATLKSLGILEFFDVIRTSDEVSAGKPSPDVYLSVAEELGVNPEKCLVFEDVPMGILAGKNAGMKVCAIEDTFSEKLRERKKELADYFINSFEDLTTGKYEVL